MLPKRTRSITLYRFDGLTIGMLVEIVDVILKSFVYWKQGGTHSETSCTVDLGLHSQSREALVNIKVTPRMLTIPRKRPHVPGVKC